MPSREVLLSQAEEHLNRYQMEARRTEVKDRETLRVAKLSHELSKAVEMLLQAMKDDQKD